MRHPPLTWLSIPFGLHPRPMGLAEIMGRRCRRPAGILEMDYWESPGHDRQNAKLPKTAEKIVLLPLARSDQKTTLVRTENHCPDCSSPCHWLAGSENDASLYWKSLSLLGYMDIDWWQRKRTYVDSNCPLAEVWPTVSPAELESFSDQSQMLIFL
jgi:hypothetical protein